VKDARRDFAGRFVNTSLKRSVWAESSAMIPAYPSVVAAAAYRLAAGASVVFPSVWALAVWDHAQESQLL
jgi:hypothetical protein